MYRKNTSGQFVHFQGVDATTGGIKTGVTWTMRRCIDGTFAAGGGTVTEDGTTGWYKCALAQADTNGNNIGFNFTGTGAVPQTVNIITDGSPPDVNLKNAAGTAVTLDSNNVLNVSTKYLAGTALTGRDIGASVLLSTGTGTGQLDFTSGVVKANAVQWLGTACSTPTVAGVPNVNCKTWNDLATVALPLVPTTAGRTLDVSATGEAGVDWANVGSPTTSLALTGTTVGVLGDLSSTMKTSVQTAADAAVTANSLVNAIAGYIDTEVAAIKAKTDNLPASPAAVGSAMTLTSAYDFAKGTAAMTESYATLHSAPSPAQALFEIRSLLAEKSVATTTLTTKKIDGSTTAGSYTLNDATAPTSITRAS